MARLGVFSFRLKWVLAAGLVALADPLFFGHPAGSTLGGFCLALCGAVAMANPAIGRDRRGRWALSFAISIALVQIDDPTLLGMTLFAMALAVTVLSPRAAAGGDALSWSGRCAFLFICGLAGPGLDILRVWAGSRGRPLGVRALLLAVALPAIGCALFIALFAAANPVISLALASIQLPALDVYRLTFWLAVFIGVWTFLRPRNRRIRPRALAAGPARALIGVSALSVTLCLLAFNAVFAIENVLDILFLWSGARLPPGVTLAEYAHRGAYTLIATALLAGLFVLAVLRPGSETARAPGVRGLVVVWIAQNLVLVASSAQRTLSYVQAYSLTSFRLAALVWMALVGVGLILICWRLLRGHSASWLINANALAVGLALTACACVDLDAVAAEWNVTHARELGGAGAPLDLHYLRSMGEGALVALSELESRPLAPPLRAEVAQARAEAMQNLMWRQADWHGWTWRGYRRLRRANAIAPSFSATLAGGAVGRS